MDFQVKLEQRLAMSLLVACTKMFPCGFFWQLMGFAAPSSFSHVEFACLTGAGDAIGVFLGNMLQSIILRAYTHPATSKDKHASRKSNRFGSFFLAAAICDSIILAIGGFCSGATWQPMVDIVSGTVDSFTLGAFYVGVSMFDTACGVLHINWNGLKCSRRSRLIILIY